MVNNLNLGLVVGTDEFDRNGVLIYYLNSTLQIKENLKVSLGVTMDKEKVKIILNLN